MKTNNGFILQKTETVQEVNGKVSTYVHSKTGATLLHIATEDIEKSFCVSFRTLPENSTGVAHIIEHSVLAGSKKYPVKEPFVEMMKGSVQSFLNAMTFPDRTMYPFASPNEKDFYNLLSVYLDAVFCPTIYTNKYTFMQEGWHYEIDPDDKLIINGVVYNEMKGAMSSPNRMLYQLVETSLFDNLYKYNSGGAPEVIPELSQKQFEQFHSTYYHPSNCVMCVYGDIEIDGVLKYIEDNYLSKYEKSDAKIVVPTQEPIGYREITDYYGIAENDTPENKTFIAKSCVMGDYHDKELTMALDILSTILLDTEASPLKKALLQAGVGQNISGGAETDLVQPIFSVVAESANPEDKDKFIQVYTDTLTDLVKNGIDPKLVEACVSSVEFKLREGGGYGPKGIIYAIQSTAAWNYGDDPVAALKYEDVIKSIKSKMNKGFFEGIINQYLLNSNHSSLIVFAPKKGVNEANEQAQKEKLAKIRASLTESQVAEIKDEAAKLLAKQQSPDNPEDLAKIPRLTIADIDPKTERVELKETVCDGIKTLYYDLFTSGIAYTNLIFDVSHLSLEELQYLQVLAFSLNKLGTKKRNYSELSNDINICSGGISAEVRPFSNIKSRKCTPYLIVSSRAVYDKLADTYALTSEMINEIDLDDSARLNQLIQTAFATGKMFFQNAGHAIANSRQKSYYMEEGKYADATGGLSYYYFIKDLMEKFPTESEKIIAKLKEVCAKVFGKKNLTVYLAGEKKAYDILQKSFGALTEGLTDKVYEVKPFNFVPSNDNEGIATQSKVQYVSKGYSYVEDGFTYTGKLVTLYHYLHSGYLWNNLRVTGGAYGFRMSFSNYGYIQIVSYRDPHLQRTLDVYDGIAEHLRTTTITQEELDMHIIAAIGEVDAPRAAQAKAAVSFVSYLSGFDNDDKAKRKQEILATTVEDVKKLADLFDCVMKKDSICVYGNEAKVNESKKIFKSIITL